MRFGLTREDLDYLCKAFSAIPEIEEVVIFGSRAMNTHRRGSDVDLAIKGKMLDPATVAHLRFILEEELPLPYFFDVVDYSTIRNTNLKAHIDRHGEIVYRKGAGETTRRLREDDQAPLG
jgi:predicted nucleotidyltransferase